MKMMILVMVNSHVMSTALLGLMFRDASCHFSSAWTEHRTAVAWPEDNCMGYV
jgi:hypothetical protein